MKEGQTNALEYARIKNINGRLYYKNTRGRDIEIIKKFRVRINETFFIFSEHINARIFASINRKNTMYYQRRDTGKLFRAGLRKGRFDKRLPRSMRGKHE